MDKDLGDRGLHGEMEVERVFYELVPLFQDEELSFRELREMIHKINKLILWGFMPEKDAQPLFFSIEGRLEALNTPTPQQLVALVEEDPPALSQEHVDSLLARCSMATVTENQAKVRDVLAEGAFFRINRPVLDSGLIPNDLEEVINSVAAVISAFTNMRIMFRLLSWRIEDFNKEIDKGLAAKTPDEISDALEQFRLRFNAVFQEGGIHLAVAKLACRGYAILKEKEYNIHLKLASHRL